MDQTKRTALAAFLTQRAEQVAELESRADKVIHESRDQTGYEELMRRKAELLAGLAGEAEPLLAGASEDEAAAIRGFSRSASTALRIGSVFFMSALLYPDDHRPGKPNNLEQLIRTLDQG